MGRTATVALCVLAVVAAVLALDVTVVRYQFWERRADRSVFARMFVRIKAKVKDSAFSCCGFWALQSEKVSTPVCKKGSHAGSKPPLATRSS